jgi:demethylmenaquinone methyltransferase/2-methoxy-6-polyprenyl-1,4-benzoquinol methylase
LNLPFPEASFDAVTVAFGVRNLSDMDRGLREMLRVLKPGGKLVVLEFSRPTAPVLSGLYRFYLGRILPRIGDGVSGKDGPYRYLARTIADFPEASVLAGRIREAGFAACEWSTMTGGVVAAHTAVKRRPSRRA